MKIEGFVGQNGKADGFFGVGKNSQISRIQNLQLWQQSLQARDQKLVASASTRDNELVDMSLGDYKVLDRLGNAASGDLRSSADQIFKPVREAAFQERRYKRFTELLPPGGLRRSARKIVHRE